METNPDSEDSKILWNDSYFWTETSSDTNVMVYKLLIYPNRAELYPMFRWADKIKGFEGNQINLGYNKLLVDRTNKTLLMVGNQKR